MTDNSLLFGELCGNSGRSFGFSVGSSSIIFTLVPVFSSGSRV